MWAAVLIAPHVASAQATFNWTAATNGNWNDPANWTLVSGPAGPGYPSQPGDTARFSGDFITGDRDIFIPGFPTTVEVSVGSVIIDTTHRITIGSGLLSGLIFDNGPAPAVLTQSGHANSVFFGNIKLASNLRIHSGDAGATMTLEADISETGGSRSIEFDGQGTTTFGAGVDNLYTGSTTVLNGTVELRFGPRIPGDLIVGDDVGEPGTARVTMLAGGVGGNVVRVLRDGQLHYNSERFHGFHLDELFIRGGEANFIDLDPSSVATLTMEGGRLSLSGPPGLVSPPDGLRVSGSITATSIAPLGSFPGGPARITFSNFGSLYLTNTVHAFVIADGPETIDAAFDVPISETGGVAGVNKLGPGVAAFNRVNTYTGVTTVTAGTLWIDGNTQSSNVLVAGGILAGAGVVGAVNATSGTVAPGATLGVLRSGTLTLGAEATFAVTTSSIPDGLDVTGTVDLGGSLLSVTNPVTLPPLKEYTIISNDGLDPVGGTFAGLPEGAIVTTPSGAMLRISYVGGNGNDVVLANITPISYSLSEGATGTFFDEDVLIANPNTVAAPVTMTFLLPDGGTIVEQRTVAAQSRLTVHVDEIPGLEAASASVQVVSTTGLPLAVERTMFWDATHYAGHTANAVNQAGTTWHFAEGAQGFFHTYLLLANANSTATEATITFLRENDTPVTETVPLPAFSRVTVYAGDYPALVNRSFGMTVTAGLPITAERSMYFQTTATHLWSGGHVNHGTATPSQLWHHAEGATGSFFSTFILISNPGIAIASGRLVFMLPSGETIDWPVGISPKRRVTINPATVDPRLQNASFATFLIMDRPVVSERAMYWPKGTLPFGEGHVSSGATSARIWDLAEGRVGGPNNYATYILLGNSSPSPAYVTVTFLREAGAPITRSYTVLGNSRFNIDVAADVPELVGESFGARVQVTSIAGIAVERSMYWNANGIFWSGGTNALATPLPQ